MTAAPSLLQQSVKRPESVLVIIATVKEEVLLLQRRDDPTFWQSVTGSMQLDEKQPIITAWRELAEETGFTEHDGNLQDCHYKEWFDIYPERQYRYAPGVTRNLEHVFCFKMPVKKIPILSQEHFTFVWLAKDQALTKVRSDSNRNAIKNYV